MSAKVKVKATVTIELEVDASDRPDVVAQAVDDAIHEVWTMGDPDDDLNGCLWVDSFETVERFSWQKES